MPRARRWMIVTLLAACCGAFFAVGAGASGPGHARAASAAKCRKGARHCKHARPKPKPKTRTVSRPVPAPPQPPPPPQPLGFYTGATAQAAPIVVDVERPAGQVIASITYYVQEACDGTYILTVSGTVPEITVQPDGSFASSSGAVSVSGRITASGTASGSIDADEASNDGHQCSIQGLAWSASYQGATPPPAPPVPADGTYVGQTSQGEQIDLDVTTGGLYLGQIDWSAGEDCSGGDYISVTWPNASFGGGISILGGGFHNSFSFTSPGDGSSSTFTIDGRFDGNGGASGTLHVETSRGGSSCATGQITWTAHRR